MIKNNMCVEIALWLAYPILVILISICRGSKDRLDSQTAGWGPLFFVLGMGLSYAAATLSKIDLIRSLIISLGWGLLAAYLFIMGTKILVEKSK